MNSKQLERRKSPRFNVRAPLSISISRAATQEDLDAASLNVSMNGVYCKVNRHLPLFDKVLITFIISQQGETSYNLVSQCEGVVVRIEPENEESGRTEYNVALYFQNLSQSERMMLRALISTYT